MAAKKKRKKKRVRGVSGRFQSRKPKKKKGKIPLTVLRKRLYALATVIRKRTE